MGGLDQAKSPGCPNTAAGFTANRNHAAVDGVSKNLQEQIAALTAERSELRKQRKREKRAGREDSVSARIAEFSAELRKLRKKVKLCSEIEARSTEVADNLKEIQQEKSEQRKEKEQHELFRRSRTGRADLA